MFLAFDRLAKELQRTLPLQTYNVTERQIITGIELLPVPFDPAKQAFRPDAAYVCNYWQLKQFDPHLELPPLICAVEANADPNQIFFINRAAIVIYGRSLADVMLALMNASYDLGCKSSLVTEVSHSFLKCKTVPELVDEGFRALKSPVFVTDQYQKILYYSQPDQNFEAFYRELLSSEYLPVGHPSADALEDAWNTVDVPFNLYGGDWICPVLCKALTAGGAVVGYLHLFQMEREFDAQDISIAELLGNLLTTALWGQRQRVARSAQNRTERFLTDILDNLLGLPEAVLQRQMELNISFKKYLYALVVTVGDAGLPSVRRISFADFALTLQNNLPGCHSFLYKNIIFALVESNQVILSFSDFLGPLLPELKRYHLLAGVSNAMPSIVHLRDAGYQASKAIQLGSRLHPGKPVYAYHDYAIYYVSELCLKSEVLPSLCLPELFLLVDYCKENGPELLDTLRVYLRCGRMKSAAAAELSVHVNTVKYRIAQIQELTKLDLGDDDTALQLMLSFKMMEYREKFQKFEPLEY